MQIYDYNDPTTPLEVEESQLASRRKLAELLAANSMAPRPAYSNKAAIAQALTGAVAGMNLRNVEARESELGRRRDAARRAEMDTLFEFMNQTPTQGPGMPQVDDDGNALPGNMEQTAAKRMELARTMLGSRNPLLQQAAYSAMTAKPKEEESFTLKPGEQRYKGSRVVASAPAEPDKKTEAIRTLEEYLKGAGIDPASPAGQALYAAAAKKATTHQAGTSVNVDTAGSKPFWGEFGKSQAEAFAKEQEAAKGASQMLQSIGTAKELLGKGIYTGTAADWRLSAGKALKQAGFAIKDDDIANTEAFVSTMGQQVLSGIKALGAGSAISNADREFMEKIVGGKITLDPKGIDRILNISEQLARSRISTFNKKAKAIQGQAPAGFLPYSLEVESLAPRSVDDIMKQYGGQQ